MSAGGFAESRGSSSSTLSTPRHGNRDGQGGSGQGKGSQGSQGKGDHGGKGDGSQGGHGNGKGSQGKGNHGGKGNSSDGGQGDGPADWPSVQKSDQWEPLWAKMKDPDVVCRIDWSAFHKMTPPPQGADETVLTKHRQTMVAYIQQFTRDNARVLGREAVLLSLFCAVVGITSQGKDCTAAQLVGMPWLAISGTDMTTAACVFYNIVEQLAVRDGAAAQQLKDHIEIRFRGDTLYRGTDKDEYRQVMTDLHDRVRRGEHGDQQGQFTTDHVQVNVESATPAWPSVVLNTIGFQPTSTPGMDHIFKATNDMCNSHSEGVVVICHNAKGHIDPSSSWQDLDVVKKWSGSNRSGVRILFALTMGDLLHEDDFEWCQTFDDVWGQFFARFEERLPGVEAYVVTGWRAQDPSKESATERDLFNVWDRIKATVSAKPGQRNHPRIREIEARLGIARLREKYNEIVGEMSTGFVQQASRVLAAGIETLKTELQRREEVYQQLEGGRLIGVIQEFCTTVEKVAMQGRMNEVSTTDGTLVPAERMVEATRSEAKTFFEEFQDVCRRHSCGLTGVRPEHIRRCFQCGPSTNTLKHKAFCMTMLRLTQNASTLARLFELPHISRDVLVQNATGSALHESMDVQKVISGIMLGFSNKKHMEIVKLVAPWVANNLHDSYSVAVRFASERHQVLAEDINPVFSEVLRRTLQRIYFTDVRDCIIHTATEWTPNTVERDTTERERREARLSRMTYRRMRNGDRPPWYKDAHKMIMSVSTKVWDSIGGGRRRPDAKQGTAPDLEDEDDSDADSSSEPVDDKKLERARRLCDRNPAPKFNSSKFMNLEEREVQYLNIDAKTKFESLMERRIRDTFKDAEKQNHWAYSTTRFDHDGKFLCKQLYFETRTHAMENPDPHKREILDRHLDELAKLDIAARLVGMDPIHQLQFGLALQQQHDRTDLVSCDGSPRGMQQRGPDQGPRQDVRNNPFRRSRGHTCNNRALFNAITDGKPAMTLPGYRTPLHPLVDARAQQFMAEYFDNHQHQRDHLFDEAVDLDRRITGLEDLYAKLQRIAHHR